VADYVWYGEAFDEQCQTFLESYFDGKTKFHFRSEERQYENTLVKHITTSEFEDNVIQQKGNQATKQCVVEVYKKDCDACHYNARMYDILSQKMNRHGLLQKVPLFRMNLDNINPYLGRFLYAPQYLYVESTDGQITQLKTLRPLGDRLNCTTFLDDLQESTKVPLKERIKIDSRRHIVEYANKKNLSDNFDYDFDIAPSN